MKLELTYYGNPVLRKKAAAVEKFDSELTQLVENMIETMNDLRGIGLAAPQVNVSLRIFITKVPIQEENGEWMEGKERVYINPKILSYSEENQTTNEGCISIPKLYMDVIRPRTIRIQAYDLKGNLFEDELSDLFAANFMHENDHLNGVLIIDRIDKKERARLEPLLKKIKDFK